jgi:diketogulonate reductase-like aldo/keto reductase
VIRARAFGAAWVPPVGLGTWNLERDDRSAAIAAIRAALDLGATHVDTAELYGWGRVEELVGEAIAGRREEVFLVSKVVPEHASRAGTVAACEQSLRRLRTDHLDCFLLHWPGEHPLEDTVAAFESLVSAGKIRQWGVSNFDAEELARVVALAGPGRVACDQVLYHLEERAVEHDVLPACREHGVALVAYSPFGSRARPWGRQRVLLERIARERGLTPHAVALAFLLRNPEVLVIPKTARPDRVAENARGDVDLSPEELGALDAAFARGPRRTTLPTL